MTICSRSLRTVACLFAAAALVPLVGCDSPSSKADKTVKNNLDSAIAIINGSDEDRENAGKLLQAAAAETNASAALRIDLKELLGQLEMRNAERLGPKIDREQAEIQRLVWEIHSLGSQIQSSNQLAAALSQYDPTTLQGQLKKAISDVQGSADQTQWLKTSGGGVPSLAAITVSETALQSQITDLQSTIKTLSDQRTAQQTQADDLSQQSDKATGDKAVDLYKQGAEARKRSEELSVQIDANNVKLARAQIDLGVAQGQEKALTAAIKNMGDKSDESAKVWKTIQQEIEGQKQQAKDLLGEGTADAKDPTGGATIASKASFLQSRLEAIRADRQDAETHLNNAVEFFKDAAAQAGTLQNELQLKMNDPKNINRPDAQAWKDEAAIIHPARFQLQDADALDHRATLAAARAADAASVLNLATALKPALDAAQLTLPASLTDADNKLASDVKGGRQLADSSYQDANERLTDVTGGSASDDQKKAARIAAIFTQYGWYMLSSSVGDKNASAHLDEAKANRDGVIQNGGEVKGLPPELAATTPAPSAPAH